MHVIAQAHADTHMCKLNYVSKKSHMQTGFIYLNYIMGVKEDF